MKEHGIKNKSETEPAHDEVAKKASLVITHE